MSAATQRSNMTYRHPYIAKTTTPTARHDNLALDKQ